MHDMAADTRKYGDGRGREEKGAPGEPRTPHRVFFSRDTRERKVPLDAVQASRFQESNLCTPDRESPSRPRCEDQIH